ncbi:hypothetical protein L596_010604 [Steinernema carpocapsae]|uniref:Uncharacterized protein n=1 Tax=Steinernema carpocapsae TaxID=34508 RepID=A0A4U5PJF6_STECR|nr:hypothetical protein L596_010604 [Steinernema carpocapsae]
MLSTSTENLSFNSQSPFLLEGLQLTREEWFENLREKCLNAYHKAWLVRLVFFVLITISLIVSISALSRSASNDQAAIHRSGPPKTSIRTNAVISIKPEEERSVYNHCVRKQAYQKKGALGDTFDDLVLTDCRGKYSYLCKKKVGSFTRSR